MQRKLILSNLEVHFLRLFRSLNSEWVSVNSYDSIYGAISNYIGIQHTLYLYIIYSSFVPHKHSFEHTWLSVAWHYVYKVMGSNCCKFIALVFEGRGWQSGHSGATLIPRGTGTELLMS